MGSIVRSAASLDNKLLADFDRLRKRQNYASRSEAVRDLIRDHRVKQGWDDKADTMGTVTLGYGHHTCELTESSQG